MILSVCALIINGWVLTSTGSQDVCADRPISRRCASREDPERIYFNVTSGRCQTFDYRTCSTGSNSFTAWQDCIHACVCQLPPRPVPCGDFSDITSIGSVFFNAVTRTCQRFPSGHEGCTVNGNAFRNRGACKMTCVCSLPPDPGTCDDRARAFYFNSDRWRCEEFVYTGCGGNANRFDSMRRCKEQCLCGLPRAPSEDEPQCDAYIPSWFYNGNTQRCVRFIYRGCGGNNNRFRTRRQCRNACKPRRS